MLGFRWNNWVSVLLLIPMFLIHSCGGGGSSTAPPPPTATTTTATAITVHTVSLNGTVNPNAQATTAHFEYGTDDTLASPMLTTSKDVGAGSTAISVNEPIIGLTLGTTYYYRIAATNASGTQKGTIETFTTALPNSPPAVTTDAATLVTNSGATLNGTVNPNELVTTVHFEYGVDATLASPILTTPQDIGGGTTSVATTASLSGLMIPGTTYYFRVVATNSAGASEGDILSFITVEQPPTVTTAAPTSVMDNSATLNGSANPNGLATNAQFEYGTDSSLASATTLTALDAIGAGVTDVSTTASLSGLTPGTTYYFRVVATNSAGTLEGDIVSFITGAQPPTVATAAATLITTTSVTLNGTVNPNEVATDAQFEYGTDSGLASATTLTTLEAIGAGMTDVSVTAPLSGLTPNTTYYFRVVATNLAGTSEGMILSFNTPTSFDGFSTDTSGSYTSQGFDLPAQNPSATPQFNYDAGGEQLEILAGDNFGLTFSNTLPANSSGVFSFDFLPRETYPSGGGVWVRLIEDGNNYYEIAAFEWDAGAAEPSRVTKFVGGVQVDNSGFANINNYVSQDPNPTSYPVTITFSPTMTTLQAFGETIVLSTDTTSINVLKFEIEMRQQDAYIDNIEFDAP